MDQNKRLYFLHQFQFGPSKKTRREKCCNGVFANLLSASSKRRMEKIYFWQVLNIAEMHARYFFRLVK